VTRWSALLALCVLLLGPRTAHAGDAPAGPPADFGAIDAYVTAQMQAMHIPGAAVGIVRGTEIVHLRGFGVADPDGRPMTAQTPVVLGSTSKSFTALAIMQLVEAGTLDLDAPVQRYLPWFRVGGPDAHASSIITVRHLLTHVSGIPTGGLVGSWVTGPPEEPRDHAVRALATLPLTAPVGARYQYSNGNYVILGLLIETVSGQSYESYVRDHIFGPLRMGQSFASEGEARRHGLASGHRWWFGLPIAETLPSPRASVPAGWLISSAQDMAQYLVAQLDDGRYRDQAVLSPSGIAELHRPAVSTGARAAGGKAYGMGWAISTSGELSIFHSGETAGSHSDMAILPDQRLGVVVLTNVNGNAALAPGAQGVIAQGVQRLLLGEQPPAKSSFWPRYLVFDAALLLCTALAIWSAVRLARGRRFSSRRRVLGVLAGVALPLLWELALPVWLLAGLPHLAQASWPLILESAPDLGYWLLALSVLLLATGIVRLVRNARLTQHLAADTWHSWTAARPQQRTALTTPGRVPAAQGAPPQAGGSAPAP
jgi:CubicO group peptidase (beta-lactamase class C family)